ncbi:MAG: hypothetical protein IJB00_05715 [Akkermansia sp.]|nr:hypothetical protein [Akkermansia sp.]
MKQKIFRIIIFLSILVALDLLTSAFFLKGMERYYGLNQEADILIVGHSHMMKACNKDMLENGLGLKISKYCREGVMIRERLGMVRHFLDTQQDSSVPIVLYGVDPKMFNEENLSANSYRLFYPFMDSKPIDELVRREAVKWHDYPLHKWIRSARFADIAMYRACRGWLSNWESMEDGIVSDKVWNMKRDKIRNSDELVQLFYETIEYLRDNNCHVVLVYPGIIRGHRDADPETFDANIELFQALAAKHPNVDFLNYGPMFSHRKEIFEDSVHLNRAGEKEFSIQLIKDIEDIIRTRNIRTSREQTVPQERIEKSA